MVFLGGHYIAGMVGAGSGTTGWSDSSFGAQGTSSTEF